MRKIITLIVIALSCLSVQAKLWPYKDNVVIHRYNELLHGQTKDSIRLLYDDENKKFIIASSDGLYTVLCVLTLEQACDLNRLILKYEKWSAKATKLQTTLEKHVGTFTMRVGWGYGNHNDVNPAAKVTVIILSQSKSSHQMVLYFGDITGYNGDTYQPRPMYFYYDEAESFRKLFTKEYFSKFRHELMRKRELEKEFK